MSSVAVDNKQLIQEYFNALSGQPKTAKVVNLYVSDEGLKEHIRVAEEGFPEYELEAQQIVAEGNLVAARCTFRGVHRGAFAGIPATGRSVSQNFMIFYRIEGGRIAEHWMEMDFREVVGQLTKS